MKQIPIVLLLLTRLASQDSGTSVRYELRFPNAAHHEAEVRVTFPDVRTNVLEVVMSRSSPGRYALHEFAKNVYDVRAHDAAGRPLAITRATPYQWNVSGHNGSVVFEYTLFGDALDGTYSAIDATHAHLNPPATFAWARGFESRPVQVQLEAPAGAKWEVATQLQPSGNAWTESSRDMLMDSPIEFGPHAIREWTLQGTRFVLAMHTGSGNDDAIAEYARLCQAMTSEAAGVFGSFPKYDHGQYTFLIDYLPYASGDGMEHRNSTVITQNVSKSKRSFAEYIDGASHEFFHSWNVERIRPRSLEPFDLERANMSAELWFAEGFTNYYSPLIQARAGITSLDELVKELGGAVNIVLTSPGREVFDAAEMSRFAPFTDRASNADPTNQANNVISYYYQGEALGLGIDFEIRTRFPGKSLDDWMRAMWAAHPDVNKPYTMEDLEATLGSFTSEEFARDIFQRYILGRESMPYAELLTRAGLVLRKAASNDVWLGVSRTSVTSQGVSITAATLRGSPAYVAGLDRGDRIVAVDGKEINEQKDWDKVLKSHKAGERSVLQVEGREGTRMVDLVWQAPPTMEIVSYEKAKLDLTPAMRDFRAAWLKSRASSTATSQTETRPIQ